jgi:alkylation response protein AidB-like acyl-CoA dehydrogenase
MDRHDEPHRAAGGIGRRRAQDQGEPVGDGTFRIKGTKIFISFGDHDMADNIVHLVLARTPDAPAGTKGLSLFLVPKYRLMPTARRAPFNDVRTVSIEHKMGLHASPTCVLSFGDHDDCIGELIGGELGGIRAMFTMMNNARLNVGLQGVQVAERATQRAVAYARERVQSARAGSPSREPVAIVEHPDVRRMLMRMKAQTQAARALVYYAFGQLDRADAGDAAAEMRGSSCSPRWPRRTAPIWATKSPRSVSRSMAAWAISRRPAPPSISATRGSPRSTRAPTASRPPIWSGAS